ncbi:hypothetical protein M2322_004866 [Rhodoblastus acidophilus]|nr:hypothetical protein [Rhodoblastus acidophilus]
MVENQTTNDKKGRFDAALFRWWNSWDVFAGAVRLAHRRRYLA